MSRPNQSTGTFGKTAMKQCPHCHEESFGWRELIRLGYFSTIECEICGQPVRNNGVRLFLTFPAILVSVFLGGILLSVLPGSMEALGFLSIFLLIGISWILLAKPSTLENPNADLPSFTPDLKNNKTIMVCGWKEVELAGIIDDFKDESPIHPPIDIEIQKRFESEFVMTFPGDIAPWDFAALVNHLNYPIDFDSAGRPLVVAGRTTLSPDFTGIPESLHGKNAVIYVRENDDDHTVVYMHTETGDSFAGSFNEMIWEMVDEPRLPAKVSALKL
jgi:hypothetical protein